MVNTKNVLCNVKISGGSMKVKELVSCCYDKIIIYASYDDEMMDFKDLYKGDKDNIPGDLLELDVKCFGAKRKGFIDISVK